jgi:hypothetical protein
MASRTDGYTFVITQCADDVPRIIAGRRYFTIAEARAHWTKRPGEKALREESIALVDHLERMATIQGWIKPATVKSKPKAADAKKRKAA